MIKQNVNILSIDAKDLYLSNHYVDTDNEKGYNIRNKNGNINTKKFINTAEFSLDLIKLREIYEKVYRNTNFSFSQKKHEYSTQIINVTFNYRVNNYNKINKNIFVKEGYNINNIVLKDNVCVINSELIAIQIKNEVESPINNELLGNYFYYENGQYQTKNNFKSIKSRRELREELYVNGFYCDGVKYIRFKRSSGASRVGKCLFINEKFYARFHKWEMCGIKIKEGQECDLASLEAYIALTQSSIIDILELRPNNILVIDDYISEFEENVIETIEVDKKMITKPNRVKIKNAIWDGQSIIDESVLGDYSQYGMVLLREQLFKSCCFNGKIQKWFKDNNITSINQLNGFTLAKKIKDIKLITTPSSIKYLKFGTIQQWLENIEGIFGIVKHEKPTHFFNGTMVSTHYQLLNTLQLTKKETEQLVKPSLDYITLLKKDSSVLRNHIKYPNDVEFEATSLNTKNDIIYKLLGLNEDFNKTKWYNEFKSSLIKSMVKNLRKGHLLIEGNYSTLFGNPIEMLQYSIGNFNGISQLGKGNIHSKRFEYNTKLLGSRSPHVTISNIWLPINQENKLIDKYFNLTNEIVCINSIGESVLDRLSGCDFDSDTVMLTNNKMLVEVAERNYNNFLVPFNNILAVKTKRRYTDLEKVDLDYKTSENIIGEIDIIVSAYSDMRKN